MARRLLEPLRDLGASVAAIPALLMVVVFVALGAAEGGYFPTAFGPAALFAVALLVTALLTVSTRAAVPRTVMLAVALLAAYAAWSYLAILWAGDPGSAWDGANRSLMYAAVFALFALWPLRAGAAATVVGAFGLGIAALGAVTLARAAAAADVSEMFVYGRLAEPVGYTNGNVALWFSGLLPCVFLAARREVWPPLRGLALGGAGLLAGLTLIGQSRGWLAALPIALIAFFAIVPGRVRNAAALIGVAIAVLLWREPLLDVFGAQEERALEPLISSAAQATFFLAAVLALVGTSVAFADRGLELAPRAAWQARLAAGAAVTAGAVAAGAVALASLGDPAAKASELWQDLKAGGDPATQPTGETRFGSVGGQNRYDYWRVALERFRERPLVGGVDFQAAYLRDGESTERPRFPHSLEVRVLSETGIAGGVLFAGGVVAALVAGLRAVRRRSPLAAAAAGTGIATFLYWLAHGSIEWFYEVPALAAPAFAMLGLAASLAPRPRPDPPRRSGQSALVDGRAGTALVVVAAVSAALALGAPWLAQRHVDRAIASWQADPNAAFSSLDRATALNPLSIEPHATAAAIALRLDRPYTAVEEFRGVLDRHPDDAYGTLQLGALASQLGRPDDALALLRRAAELSPRDDLVRSRLREVRAGEILNAAEVYDAALERRRSLTGN